MNKIIYKLNFIYTILVAFLLTVSLAVVFSQYFRATYWFWREIGVYVYDNIFWFSLIKYILVLLISYLFLWIVYIYHRLPEYKEFFVKKKLIQRFIIFNLVFISLSFLSIVFNSGLLIFVTYVVLPFVLLLSPLLVYPNFTIDTIKVYFKNNLRRSILPLLFLMVVLTINSLYNVYLTRFNPNIDNGFQIIYANGSTNDNSRVYITESFASETPIKYRDNVLTTYLHYSGGIDKAKKDVFVETDLVTGNVNYYKPGKDVYNYLNGVQTTQNGEYIILNNTSQTDKTIISLYDYKKDKVIYNKAVKYITYKIDNDSYLSESNFYGYKFSYDASLLSLSFSDRAEVWDTGNDLLLYKFIYPEDDLKNLYNQKIAEPEKYKLTGLSNTSSMAYFSPNSRYLVTYHSKPLESEYGYFSEKIYSVNIIDLKNDTIKNLNSSDLPNDCAGYFDTVKIQNDAFRLECGLDKTRVYSFDGNKIYDNTSKSILYEYMHNGLFENVFSDSIQITKDGYNYLFNYKTNEIKKIDKINGYKFLDPVSGKIVLIKSK